MADINTKCFCCNAPIMSTSYYSLDGWPCIIYGDEELCEVCCEDKRVKTHIIRAYCFCCEHRIGRHDIPVPDMQGG